MAPKHPSLFTPDDLGPKVPAGRSRRRHLKPLDAPSEQTRWNADGARMVPGLSDGLPVRVVKPHSASKARAVGLDLGTVGRAMGKKPWPIHYLELFSGPGYLQDSETEEELPGSPMQALGIERPFTRYVFADFSSVCVEALDKRIEAMRRQGQHLPETFVRQGDANDPRHLDDLCSLIDPRALVIAYLDPAGPDLHFSTVEFLARRFRFIDFIINLPFSGIYRSMAAGGVAKPAKMLNHPDPCVLIDPRPNQTAHNIREHYNGQLRSLGLDHITSVCIKTEPTQSPLYDIVVASRNELAVRLWENANRKRGAIQLGLAGFDAC